MMIRPETLRYVYGCVGALLALLLVYASILPLEYVPLGWDKALGRWQSIPWLHLGVSSRADWIANGLVVVPIGFFLSGSFAHGRTCDFRIALRIIALLLFLALLIVGIEFLQIWFPRRTMSRNDIVAGWVGGVVGVSLWFSLGARITSAAIGFLRLGSIASRIQQLAFAACIFSVLYSLFPFDFVLSREEFFTKISNGRIGILGVASTGLNAETLKGILSSFIRMVPFGIAIGLGPNRRLEWGKMIVISFILELIQIPIFSKYSSVLDWLFGFIGGLLSVQSVRQFGFWSAIRRKSWLWIALLAIWVFLLYAAYVGVWPFGLGRATLTDPAAIGTRWHNFITPPFLRYYFPSEYSAFTTFLGKLLSFMVLGVLSEAYLDSVTEGRSWKTNLAMFSVFSAIALAIEFSQIYVEDQVADSTDVLIFVCGGLLGGRLLRSLLYGIGSGNREELISNRNPTQGFGRTTSNTNWLAGFVFMLGLFLSASHPGWPVLQSTMVFVVATLVYFRWDYYPLFFVTSLSAADAYPLTGQLAIQEYDSLLLAATSGLLVSRSLCQPFEVQFANRWFKAGWFLLASALVTGFVIGIYRLPVGNWGDQLSAYFTKWNAIRVGKGILWGLVFYRLTCLVQVKNRIVWSRSFILGLILASSYVGFWVLFERAIFPGIFNLREVYRATGPFFTMHIGDQHIDAFLIIVFPVVFGATMGCFHRMEGWRHLLLFFSSLMILVLTVHAVFATMSRGTLLALAAQFVLLLVGTVLGWQKERVKRPIVSLAILVLPLIGLFTLVFYSALAARFNSSLEDTQGRLDHWSTIVKKGTTGVGGLIVGHGIGCFPSMMSVHRELVIPPALWRTDGKEGRIELQPGWPLYVERLASRMEHDDEESPKLCVRTLGTKNQQVVSYRVEKSLLQSYGYQASERLVESGEKAAIGWPTYLTRDPLDENALSGFRSVYLGVSPPKSAGMVLSNSGDGEEMISHRTSYPWIFTCDDHLVWRAKNFLVHAYYEQGLLGVAAWICLVLGSVSCGVRFIGSTKFDQQVIAWLGLSVLGFVIVGMFGTLIDTPWISALILGCISITGILGVEDIQ